MRTLAVFLLFFATICSAQTQPRKEFRLDFTDHWAIFWPAETDKQSYLVNAHSKGYMDSVSASLTLSLDRKSLGVFLIDHSEREHWSTIQSFNIVSNDTTYTVTKSRWNVQTQEQYAKCKQDLLPWEGRNMDCTTDLDTGRDLSQVCVKYFKELPGVFQPFVANWPR